MVKSFLTYQEIEPNVPTYSGATGIFTFLFSKCYSSKHVFVLVLECPRKCGVKEWEKYKKMVQTCGKNKSKDYKKMYVSGMEGDVGEEC